MAVFKIVNFFVTLLFTGISKTNSLKYKNQNL
jgi:hypothetical protein